jgi:NAD(P)-dependent dehydrogenase (short-subunit alcohol dehydrogenase family)
VRAAAGAFSARHRRLDILCNNAGVMGHHAVQLTPQGFEMQFGTNHLGHFALTGLLFDALNAAPAPRVVAVSSVAHRATRGLNLDDPRFERTRYWHFDAYGKSKLANLTFALELNRRARKAGLALKALAAHPGYSATNITSGTNQAGNKVKDFVVGLGNSMMGMPPQRGAMPTLYASTAASIEGGEFIGPDGLFELWGGPSPRKPSRLAQDPALAGRLWQKSQEWTGVRFLEA